MLFGSRIRCCFEASYGYSFFSNRVRFIHLIFQLLTFNLVEILVQKLVESFCDFFSLGQTSLHRTEFMVDNFRREFFVVTLLLSFYSVCFCYSLICDYWPRTSAPNAIEKSNLWPFGQEERSLIRSSYFLSTLLCSRPLPQRNCQYMYIFVYLIKQNNYKNGHIIWALWVKHAFDRLKKWLDRNKKKTQS